MTVMNIRWKIALLSLCLSFSHKALTEHEVQEIKEEPCLLNRSIYSHANAILEDKNECRISTKEVNKKQIFVSLSLFTPPFSQVFIYFLYLDSISSFPSFLSHDLTFTKSPIFSHWTRQIISIELDRPSSMSSVLPFSIVSGQWNSLEWTTTNNFTANSPSEHRHWPAANHLAPAPINPISSLLRGSTLKSAPRF